MNPAALKTNLQDLRPGGILITNSGAYTEGNLEKAGYKSNPLDDDALKKNYKVVSVDMDKLTQAALAGSGLSNKDVARCRNYFALGMMYWLYSRPPEAQLENIRAKFKKKPEIAEANVKVFQAGHAFGETTELFLSQYTVPAAKLAPGTYRNVTGNGAAALGLAAVAKLTGRQVFLGSYPITPATEILQDASYFKDMGVVTYQAEDEIAGIGSAIGASFGGSLGVTTTSGPGLALKSEMLGLAVIAELPLVVIDVQRGGPSTGMPTKTEQSDLYIALFGRHGEAPMPVIAARSPADCFYATIEAFQIATKWMTPVLLLTDGYLGFGSEPFRIPEEGELKPFEVKYQTTPNYNGQYMPYLRDAKLIRPWAIPGTAGPRAPHRRSREGLHVGHGVLRRHEPREDGEDPRPEDPQRHRGRPRRRGRRRATGDLLLLSWGGTYGSVRGAAARLRAQGKKVGHVHLRWLNPLPKNLGSVLKAFKKVLVPEVNDGQLANYLRMSFPGLDPLQFNRINGKAIKISELTAKVNEILG